MEKAENVISQIKKKIIFDNSVYQTIIFCCFFQTKVFILLQTIEDVRLRKTRRIIFRH